MVWRVGEWEQGCAERWAWRLLLGGPEASPWWGLWGYQDQKELSRERMKNRADVQDIHHGGNVRERCIKLMNPRRIIGSQSRSCKVE